MGGQSKRPSFGGSPPVSEKQPRSAFPDPTGGSQTPNWLVAQMDFDGPYGWHVHVLTTILDLHSHLKNVESTTWVDLDRSGSHYVEYHRLDKPARDRLAQLKLTVERLYSLRLTGKKRVWGIRTGRTLSVLWWDPEHEVCPSEKKHT